MAKLLLKAGDVVWVDLNPTRGGEKSKTRPCLVLVGSGHPWKIVVVVPLTNVSGKRTPALFVAVPADAKTGLNKPSCVDCFQIRCISEERIVSKIGVVTTNTLADVRTRLASILDIGEEHVS